MQPDKALMMMGMAQKAGKIASGEFSVEKAVKEGRAHLVVVAVDASENTKKKMRNMTSFYNTDMIFLGTKETLGKSLGKECRSSAAVLSEGFAASIRLKADENTTE